MESLTGSHQCTEPIIETEAFICWISSSFALSSSCAAVLRFSNHCGRNQAALPNPHINMGNHVTNTVISIVKPPFRNYGLLKPTLLIVDRPVQTRILGRFAGAQCNLIKVLTATSTFQSQDFRFVRLQNQNLGFTTTTTKFISISFRDLIFFFIKASSHPSEFFCLLIFWKCYRIILVLHSSLRLWYQKCLFVLESFPANSRVDASMSFPFSSYFFIIFL